MAFPSLKEFLHGKSHITQGFFISINDVCTYKIGIRFHIRFHGQSAIVLQETVASITVGLSWYKT